MDSTPAVGSCGLPPCGNAPNKVGPFRSTMVLCCYVEKALGEVLVREPVLLSRKLAGRDSNPLDLAVVPCTPNRQPSVFRVVG